VASWGGLEAIVRPHSPKGENGRPPVGLDCELGPFCAARSRLCTGCLHRGFRNISAGANFPGLQHTLQMDTAVGGGEDDVTIGVQHYGGAAGFVGLFGHHQAVARRGGESDGFDSRLVAELAPVAAFGCQAFDVVVRCLVFKAHRHFVADLGGNYLYPCQSIGVDSHVVPSRVGFNGPLNTRSSMVRNASTYFLRSGTSFV